MDILISAPYMIMDRDELESELDELPADVHWAEVEECLTESELLDVLPGMDGIICGDDEITRTVIDQADALKVIVKWGTGIDSINKSYAEEQGIPVRNTEDAFSVPVAETVLGLILTHLRRIFQSHKLMKKGKWKKPKAECLSESTVGVIGIGNAGSAVTRRLQALGARVLVNDIKWISSDLLSLTGIQNVSKKKLYQQSDIITLHCDLNKSSHHLIDQEAFDAMDKHPFLINTARGPLIREPDLIDALKKNVICGAALDVFEEEPLAKDHPLRQMENVILSSHNANSSQKYWNDVHRNSIRMLKEELHL